MAEHDAIYFVPPGADAGFWYGARLQKNKKKNSEPGCLPPGSPQGVQAIRV